MIRAGLILGAGYAFVTAMALATLGLVGCVAMVAGVSGWVAKARRA